MLLDELNGLGLEIRESKSCLYCNDHEAEMFGAGDVVKLLLPLLI